MPIMILDHALIWLMIDTDTNANIIHGQHFHFKNLVTNSANMLYFVFVANSPKVCGTGLWNEAVALPSLICIVCVVCIILG